MHRPNTLASTLTVLLCAGLTTTAAVVPATASAHARPSTLRKRQRHAKASCAARAAAAHEASRACHASAQKTPHAHAPKPHRSATPKPAKAPRSENPSVSAQAKPSPEEAAAAIAAVLSTPCQNIELTPEASNLPLVRAAVLCLVNQERAANGKSPLSANPQLEQAAEGHSQELVQDDYFAHVSPSGETPVERIRDTGYIPSPSVGYVIGENLAWGTYNLDTPRAIVAAWIASPGHLANILESQYTETGIGVTPAVPASLAEGEPGGTYAQEFGVIVQ